MIAKRPSIFIYTFQPDSRIVKEICAGIEENGVFFEVFEKESPDLEQLGFEAARDSMMGTGIGICRDAVLLQMKGLPRHRYVESWKQPTADVCRRVGANSARAIKKLPLITV